MDAPLTSMVKLAFTWKDQGRDKETIVLIKKYMQFRERVMGPDHLKTEQATIY
jgi:hypothetical protein